MMTLIGLAIVVAYFYSSSVVFGVAGKKIKVVSPGYLKENDIEMKDGRIEKLNAQGKTVVFVLMDDQLQGAVALADIIREETKKMKNRMSKTVCLDFTFYQKHPKAMKKKLCMKFDSLKQLTFHQFSVQI
ncbi:MAG: hypothetical protein R6U27_10005 [Desulfobacterales bacterium]